MATYKVTFRKRYNAELEPADDPASFVQVADGVVVDARLASQTEPPATHPQGVMDEDDSYLSLGTEVWEYEIADGREQEFLDALRNSRMVLDFEEMSDVV